MAPALFQLLTAAALVLLLAVCAAAQDKKEMTEEVGSSRVRRVVMKDALSAEEFKKELNQLKSTGLFREVIAGSDPKAPRYNEVSFLTSGNYLLVIGDAERVEAEIANIRMMAYLFERPRAHLQLNLRVVQLTGPANADVIQMTETMRALVNSQRGEVVRAFADLETYLKGRLARRTGPSLEIYDEVRKLLPSLTDDRRPLTVPEILLLLMLDRSSPLLPPEPQEDGPGSDAERALLELPRTLAELLRDPKLDDARIAMEIQDELGPWKIAVANARDWFGRFAEELEKKNGLEIGTFHEALERPGSPVPPWIALRLARAAELTQRLYPNLTRRHTSRTLEELERRFALALERAEQVEQAIARGEEPPQALEREQKEQKPQRQVRPGYLGRNLLALKSIADDLVPLPLALFEMVAAAADDGAPSPEQLIEMIRAYTEERRNLDLRLRAGDPEGEAEVGYEKLQTLEASLNLWLRRASEAMATALEQQFYSRYVDQLRLLANKQLGKSSSRDILSTTELDDVPDVVRDFLLADTGVNIFVSNSVSLQFAPDTQNSVAAEVQAQLPSKKSLLERVQEAGQAASALNLLTQQYGIGGESIVKALLAGGQAVPVQAGIDLAATPSIGFDASTVTLSLTANQTLQPDSNKVADRVTRHSINNATITALTYEPMVLSTLASNVSYYVNSGGIPILRKVPLVKSLLKDIPFKPFQERRRQKGVYQSSVIILEPVVIPTIEDLVRFHGGWRRPAATQ